MARKPFPKFDTQRVAFCDPGIYGENRTLLLNVEKTGPETVIPIFRESGSARGRMKVHFGIQLNEGGFAEVAAFRLELN